MLSALLRAGHSLTAGLSCLSTADSILMSYQILEEQGAGRYLSVPTAGLCYDTPPVEAMPFPIDIPDKTPRALS